MLPEHKQKLLTELTAQSSKEELAWMHGYIAGLLGTVSPGTATAVNAGNVAHRITIAFGTETGNSKRAATAFAAKAKKLGMQAKLVSLDQYRFTDLPKEDYFLTIISTQGEGEPPEAAKKFYDNVHTSELKLDKMKFSVLALGDTSYPLFCKAGEDIDQQFEKMGAQRIAPLQKCDVEFEADANKWFEDILHKLSAQQAPVAAATPAVAAATEKKPGGKKNYTGTVLTNINLNDRGSNKETFHIEIAAEQVDYEPGDALGIIPANADLVVEKVLSLSQGINAGKKITYKSETHTIFELLKYKLNISHLITPVIKRYATLVRASIEATKMDLVDLLQAHPVKDSEQFEAVLALLNPIAPRLYTMASSPAAHQGEVHLIVAKDVFMVNQEKKYGVCSNYLGTVKTNTTLNFFIQKNKRFRLPAAEKDVIMIGPGTGIAPFRSFLAEREALGGAGRNWLFFGEQHFVSDFLYQTEIQNWYETGVLTNISLAFSRDQPEKIYVQHRMIERGAELYQWLKGGAYVYLCGKKDPMSYDVEHALIAIIAKHGEKTPEEAKEYFLQMESEGRFSEDVY